MTSQAIYEERQFCKKLHQVWSSIASKRWPEYHILANLNTEAHRRIRNNENRTDFTNEEAETMTRDAERLAQAIVRGTDREEFIEIMFDCRSRDIGEIPSRSDVERGANRADSSWSTPKDLRGAFQSWCTEDPERVNAIFGWIHDTATRDQSWGRGRGRWKFPHCLGLLLGTIEHTSKGITNDLKRPTWTERGALTFYAWAKDVTAEMRLGGPETKEEFITLAKRMLEKDCLTRRVPDYYEEKEWMAQDQQREFRLIDEMRMMTSEAFDDWKRFSSHGKDDATVQARGPSGGNETGSVTEDKLPRSMTCSLLTNVAYRDDVGEEQYKSLERQVQSVLRPFVELGTRQSTESGFVRSYLGGCIESFDRLPILLERRRYLLETWTVCLTSVMMRPIPRPRRL